MNNIIDLISKSRIVLKEILSKEWNTEEITELSPIEIRERYISKNIINKINFGCGSNCNITLNHLKIKDHKLHIIYYNFSEINQSPIKVTKICCDKIASLYEDTIEPNDSILVVMQTSITESLLKSFETLSRNINKNIVLEENIKQENDKLNELETLNSYNFKNIHVISLYDIIFNKFNHVLVPECRIIRNEKEKKDILEKTNSTINQLPIQTWTDQISQLLLASCGDIIEYKRKTHTAGENIYYRLCCYN